MQSTSQLSSENPLFKRIHQARFLFCSQKIPKERHSQQNAWKLQKNGQQVNYERFQSYGTKEMVKVTIPAEQSSEKMDVVFNYTYPMDNNDGLSILSIQAKIPNIKLLITRPSEEAEHVSKLQAEGQLKSQIILCQDVQNQNYFKVIYHGVEGETKISIKDQNLVKFKNIGFGQSSNGRIVFRLIIMLYRENEGNEKIFKDIYISKPLFIAQENRIIFLDDKLSILQFFAEFGIEFMAPTRRAKQSLTIVDDMLNFETHLTKRCKKILNVIYLAFKYHKICEIYFRSHTKNTYISQKEESGTDQNSMVTQCPYFIELANIMIDIKRQISLSVDVEPESKLQCNKLNPETRLVLKISQPLEKTKFVISQQYTKYLSIVIGQHEELKQFQKLERTHIKSFYRFYLETIKNLKNIQLSSKKKKAKRGRKPKFYVDRQSEIARVQEKRENGYSKGQSNDDINSRADMNYDSQKDQEEYQQNHSANKIHKSNTVRKNYFDDDSQQNANQKGDKSKRKHFESNKRQKLSKKIAQKQAMNTPIVLKISQLPNDQKLKLETPEIIKEGQKKQGKFITPQTLISDHYQPHFSQIRNSQAQQGYRIYPVQRVDFNKYSHSETPIGSDTKGHLKDNQMERKYRYPPYFMEEFNRHAPYPYEYFPRIYQPQRVSVPYCQNCERMYFSSFGKKNHHEDPFNKAPGQIYHKQFYPTQRSERNYFPDYSYPNPHQYPPEAYRTPYGHPELKVEAYQSVNQDWQRQKRYYPEVSKHYEDGSVRNYSKQDAERYYFSRQRESQRSHRLQLNENLRPIPDPNYRYESPFSQERRQP